MSDDPSVPPVIANKLLLLRTREIDAWQLDSLLELMRDPHHEVRDWATFTVAARDDDGEEVRQALLARASDRDFDARSEALWGLARRRDARAIPLLIEAIGSDEVGELYVEAAAYLARPELVAPLEALSEWWDADPSLLAEALRRCRSEPGTGGRTWEFVPSNDPEV